MKQTYRLNLANSPFNKRAFKWTADAYYIFYDPMRIRADEAMYELSESVYIDHLESLITKRSDRMNLYEAKMLEEEERKAKEKVS